MKKIATELTIDRLALEGKGVSRISENGALKGSVAFVPYVLPKETISGSLVSQKKNHSHWFPIQILKPSEHRIKPRCTHFFRVDSAQPSCGGCDWQHIDLTKQREYKRDLVIETLRRIGDQDDVPVRETQGDRQGWSYRNKVQVPVKQRGKSLLMGFYAPQSHHVVPFKECPVQPDLSVSLLHMIQRFADTHRWKGFDEDRNRGWLRHILVRLNQKNQILLTLVTNPGPFPDKKPFVETVRKKFPSVIGLHQNIQKGRTNVILGSHWNKIWGESKIVEEIAGLSIQFGPGSFFQVNTKAAAQLYDKAIDYLSPTSKSIVLDLYCGVGAMTLMAAKKARYVYGIEVIPDAIRDAKANARHNRIRNVDFQAMKAESLFLKLDQDWLQDFKDKLDVIIDPPRSGCERVVLDGLIKMNPKKIVYVSCNPATFARDVKILSSNYRLEEVTPVDLFPQTSHIELVGKLVLKRHPGLDPGSSSKELYKGGA